MEIMQEADENFRADNMFSQEDYNYSKSHPLAASLLILFSNRDSLVTSAFAATAIVAYVDGNRTLV